MEDLKPKFMNDGSAANVKLLFSKYCEANGITTTSQVTPIDIASFKSRYNIASPDIRELKNSLGECFDNITCSIIEVPLSHVNYNRIEELPTTQYVTSDLGDNDIKSNDLAEKIYASSIDSLGLSRRSYNALYKAGKKSVSDIIGCTEEDLYCIPSLGAKSVKEILIVIGIIKRLYSKSVNTQNDTKDEISLESLGLSPRSYNALQAAGKTTVSDIIECIEEELEVVSKIVRDEMEHAVSMDVNLDVDLSTGDSWYETK